MRGICFGTALLAAALLAGGAAARPPSWDTQLPAAKRFLVLKKFSDAAVLDRETGLVWQAQPTATATWANAFLECGLLEAGGRRGWRLPAFEELESLVDPVTDVLPGGHPFTAPDDMEYWSASSHPGIAGSGLVLDLATPSNLAVDKTLSRRVWCVRGGTGPSF